MRPTRRLRRFSWRTCGPFAVSSVALASSPVACGARTALLDDGSPASGDIAAFAADGATRGVAPQDACRSSSTATAHYQSEAELQSLLMGRWMMCNPGTPNPYWSAAGVGLDFLGDGRVYPLFRDDAGQIVRGGGEYVWAYRLSLVDDSRFDVVFELGELMLQPSYTPRYVTMHATLGYGPEKLVLNDGTNAFAFAPAQ